MSGAIETGLAVAAATGFTVIVALVVAGLIIGDVARRVLASLARLIGKGRS